MSTLPIRGNEKNNSDLEIISLDTARRQYPKSKVLFIITDMSDLSDIKGYVFMVSSSKDSFKELCIEDSRLQADGYETVLTGSYEDGGALGVQYELNSFF